MTDVEIGRVVRALRHRSGKRPGDVARAAGASRSMVAEIEAGRIGPHRLEKLRSVVAALGGVLRLEVSWRGGELARLLDADHAALQARWKDTLERWRWIVHAEVTFSRYGERGSLDLLAFQPRSRVLLVIEIKTGIYDVQGLLASLDRKVRQAPRVAAGYGWRSGAVVPLLVVMDGSTTRRRIADHAPLFAQFELRGRSASAWLRAPGAAQAPSGLLVATKLPNVRFGDTRRAGRQRIWGSRAGARSARGSAARLGGSDGA